MKKIVVLGAGMVGKEVARDLCLEFKVTSVDMSAEALKSAFTGSPVETIQADLSRPETIQKIVEPFDLVVGALPGFMGKQALTAVISAGKNAVDIAFFPEDPFDLDELARKNDVTAVVDFGVAPGMSNVFMGYHSKKMQSVERFECLVGGLPVIRERPFEYRAVFSPSDVIEEYTRTARYVENGREVLRPALTDVEQIFIDDVGTLEAFNTDGLRTLERTMKAPNMKEKTMRYPGHALLMQAFRDSGFFDKEPMEFHGLRISPLEFTSRILFPKWRLKEDEDDFTAMRVTIEGTSREGRRETIVYNLLDRFDREKRVTSMARTTGYACTGAVRLLAGGMFKRKGICPPEFLGEEEDCFNFLMKHLEERGVRYNRSVTARQG
ncbi:MAG: saccharopine dehydrogenase C-terminal domain-containing protein [bacterium]